MAGRAEDDHSRDSSSPRAALRGEEGGVAVVLLEKRDTEEEGRGLLPSLLAHDCVGDLPYVGGGGPYVGGRRGAGESRTAEGNLRSASGAEEDRAPPASDGLVQRDADVCVEVRDVLVRDVRVVLRPSAAELVLLAAADAGEDPVVVGRRAEARPSAEPPANESPADTDAVTGTGTGAVEDTTLDHLHLLIQRRVLQQPAAPGFLQPQRKRQTRREDPVLRSVEQESSPFPARKVVPEAQIPAPRRS